LRGALDGGFAQLGGELVARFHGVAGHGAAGGGGSLGVHEGVDVFARLTQDRVLPMPMKSIRWITPQLPNIRLKSRRIINHLIILILNNPLRILPLLNRLLQFVNIRLQFPILLHFLLHRFDLLLGLCPQII